MNIKAKRFALVCGYIRKYMYCEDKKLLAAFDETVSEILGIESFLSKFSKHISSVMREKHGALDKCDRFILSAGKDVAVKLFGHDDNLRAMEEAVYIRMEMRKLEKKFRKINKEGEAIPKKYLDEHKYFKKLYRKAIKAIKREIGARNMNDPKERFSFLSSYIKSDRFDFDDFDRDYSFGFDEDFDEKEFFKRKERTDGFSSFFDEDDMSLDYPDRREKKDDRLDRIEDQIERLAHIVSAKQSSKNQSSRVRHNYDEYEYDEDDDDAYYPAPQRRQKKAQKKPSPSRRSSGESDVGERIDNLENITRVVLNYLKEFLYGEDDDDDDDEEEIIEQPRATKRRRISKDGRSLTDAVDEGWSLEDIEFVFGFDASETARMMRQIQEEDERNARSYDNMDPQVREKYDHSRTLSREDIRNIIVREMEEKHT